MVTFRRAVAFLGLLSVCFAQTTQKQRRCPETPIHTIDAKSFKLSKYRGKTVVAVMFSTACHDCLATLQLMEKLQTEYAPRGLQVVGISIDPSSANLLPFQQRNHFSFPLGHLDNDPARELAALGKTERPFTPLIMFIDWQGTIRFQYQGNDQFFKDAEKNIRGITTALLNQAATKQPPQYQTKSVPKQ